MGEARCEDWQNPKSTRSTITAAAPTTIKINETFLTRVGITCNDSYEMEEKKNEREKKKKKSENEDITSDQTKIYATQNPQPHCAAAAGTAAK